MEGVTIRGSASDPRLVWAEFAGQALPILWPGGFTAEFRPQLLVYDPYRVVVGREGEDFPNAVLEASYQVCESTGGIVVIRPGGI
jgi:hypothetical protein